MPSEFDIIFAGGGTAACVAAGRLAAADPSLKVLVVELGQHSRDVPVHTQPYRVLENLVPSSTVVSFHVSKPSEHLDGRSVVVPCGRCVGGGSAVNFMLYVRGSASDYDDWAKLGNDGWGAKDILPLMQKIETYTPQPGLPTHGYHGPIIVSKNEPELGLAQQFLSTARQYDPQRPQVDDPNDLMTGDAYGLAFKYVDPETGRRSDAASAYLYPQLGNSSIEILVGKRVKRVIIENGRAVGIEYTNAADDSGEAFILKASKLVVLSAGALGSPAILERSGIGAKSVLEQLDIPVISDLPGVGENYMDHVGCVPAYYAEGIDTMDDVWKDRERLAEFTKQWERNGKGKVAHTGFEGIAKVRPTAEELESIASSFPSFQSRWETFFQPNPDKPMAIISPTSGSLLIRQPGKYITVGYYIMYSESLGRAHITSRDNANARLDFEARFGSELSDIASLRLTYKRSRELARRIPAYRGEFSQRHPQFPPDSAAACRQTEGPVPIDAPDIAYSAEDDLVIDTYHRQNLQTVWHSMGTCAMKPREQGGVVDSRLNVYGIQGLKVADMSICPSIVGSNTYNTALLIGENAASIIAQEIGINLLSA